MQFVIGAWSDEELTLLQSEALVSAAAARAGIRQAAWESIAPSTHVPRPTFEDAWDLASSRVIGGRGAKILVSNDS